jgi:hypothetical protein
MSHEVKELESKRLAIRKRMTELRAELEPLTAKTQALTEQLTHAELDLTTVCDALREAKKFS